MSTYVGSAVQVTEDNFVVWRYDEKNWAYNKQALYDILRMWLRNENIQDDYLRQRVKAVVYTNI